MKAVPTNNTRSSRAPAGNSCPQLPVLHEGLARVTHLLSAYRATISGLVLAFHVVWGGFVFRYKLGIIARFVNTPALVYAKMALGTNTHQDF